MSSYSFDRIMLIFGYIV